MASLSKSYSMSIGCGRWDDGQEEERSARPVRSVTSRKARNGYRLRRKVTGSACSEDSSSSSSDRKERSCIETESAEAAAASARTIGSDLQRHEIRLSGSD